MLVAGDQEEADGTITPRRRHGSKQSKQSKQPLLIDQLVAQLAEDVKQRRVWRPED